MPCTTRLLPGQAVAWVIDELKATVPIWKKEFFEGGEVRGPSPGMVAAAATQDIACCVQPRDALPAHPRCAV